MPLQDDPFGGESPDPIAWVILVAGVIVLILCVWFYAMFISTPADAEFCSARCNGTNWVLELNGVAVDAGHDMTRQECGELAGEIEPQTPPFTRLKCVEYNVQRQEL